MVCPKTSAPVVLSDNADNSAKDITARFSEAGTYILNVLAIDSGGLASATSSVTVDVEQTATSIVIVPGGYPVTSGQYSAAPGNIVLPLSTADQPTTQNFTATAIDQFGYDIPNFGYGDTTWSCAALEQSLEIPVLLVLIPPQPWVLPIL